MQMCFIFVLARYSDTKIHDNGILFAMKFVCVLKECITKHSHIVVRRIKLYFALENTGLGRFRVIA